MSNFIRSFTSAPARAIDDWAVKACASLAYLALAAMAVNEAVILAATRPDLIPLAAKASVILFLITIAAAILVRGPAVGVSKGVWPRLDALAGAFLLLPMGLVTRVDVGPALHLVAAILLLGGNVISIALICNLGRSFSIMPEARQLVTSGAYRFVRHPLYLAEQVAIAGLLIEFASWPAVLLVAAQLVFQIRRMHNEEAVLRAAFPAYASYARRTARLLPFLW